MTGVARMLIVFGGVLMAAGLVMLALGRLNLPLGRLPGDLSWQGRGWSISFPIVSCLLISVVLSLVLWAVNHLRR